MSKIEVNTVDVQTGSTLTLGSSGKTVTLACGASQSGFGRTGTVDWQTSSIKTSTFTAVSGEGYFVNTTGGAVTVNLPAGTAGAIVGLKDYAGTWDDNAVTLNANGSDKIGGGNTLDPTLTSEGGSVLLVFVDSTQGWLTTEHSVTESPSGKEAFICASGGTPSQSGDYEIRTFTGTGSFVVNSLATNSPNNVIDYVVVGGGGGGGSGTSGGAGGGGAGGYRSFGPVSVSVQTYPVTIGAGGGGAPPGGTPVPAGTQGSVSTFLCNSSAGGGGGGSQGPAKNGGSGGSGGGGGYNAGSGGAGNTPPVSPPQGNAGGAEANPGCNGGGGGGAGGTGPSNTSTTVSPGGAGVDISPSYGPGVGVSGFVAGGGGGGGYCAVGIAPGGTGGGGNGAGGGDPTSPTSGNATATNGTANTGGGGGGAASRVGGPIGPSLTIGAGGSGVVIIRYKRQ